MNQIKFLTTVFKKTQLNFSHFWFIPRSTWTIKEQLKYFQETIYLVYCFRLMKANHFFAKYIAKLWCHFSIIKNWKYKNLYDIIIKGSFLYFVTEKKFPKYVIWKSFSINSTLPKRSPSLFFASRYLKTTPSFG